MRDQYGRGRMGRLDEDRPRCTAPGPATNTRSGLPPRKQRFPRSCGWSWAARPPTARSGPGCWSSMEGVRRGRQGRRDSTNGWSSGSTRATSAVYSVRQAPSAREKRHHFLWRFWSEGPRARRDVRVRPQLVRPGARRARRRRSQHPREEWNAGLRRDRTTSNAAWSVEGVIVVKFWMQSQPEGRTAEAIRELAADDPLRQLEARPTRTGATGRSVPQYDAAAEDMLER